MSVDCVRTTAAAHAPTTLGPAETLPVAGEVTSASGTPAPSAALTAERAPHSDPDRAYLSQAQFPTEEAARDWEGFTADEAHSWAGALFHVNPHPVGIEALQRAYDSWCSGQVPQVLAWSTTARAARAAGFTPLTLKILRSSLAELSPSDHPAHPRNLALVFPCHPYSLPFDFDLWHRWPGLVSDGLTPRQATLRVLHDAEEVESI